MSGNPTTRMAHPSSGRLGYGHLRPPDVVSPGAAPTTISEIADSFVHTTFMAHPSSGRLGYTPLRPPNGGWPTGPPGWAPTTNFAPFLASTRPYPGMAQAPPGVCAAGGVCGGCRQSVVGRARHYRCQACPEFRLCAACMDRHEDDPSFLPRHPRTHLFVRISAATAASSTI